MYISESMVEKLLKEAGAGRVSKEAKQEFRKYMEKTAFDVAQKAVKLAQHAKRKTVDASDIKLAIP
ncbi:MAG: NFYB/HAP3 family transcription factor subunit [Candidatus Micrarchaeaceae archaeon]